MDEHLRLLLHWVRRGREQAPSARVVGRGGGAASSPSGQGGEGGPYVWWAKLRSPNRQDPLPHRDEVLTLDEQIGAGVETHLYLTDYRSLYVGQLDEITADPVPEEHQGELEHMPVYYRGKPADFWFRLRDIRRLVAGDTPAVIAELKKLRNTRYHDRPVSLYGGMVELPLIVTRGDELEWFADREALLEGRLWAERDAELRGETERMMRELRDNLLGSYVWSNLEPASRVFLGSAEAVFRARREDPAFDFSGPAVEYAKTVEVELNALIFPPLRSLLANVAPRNRVTRLDGRELDLGGRVSHRGLGTIKTLLEKDTVVRKGIQQVYRNDYQWILGVLPHHLEPLVEVRNPAAHSAAIDRECVTKMRDRVLGVGQEGLVVRVVRGRGRRG